MELIKILFLEDHPEDVALTELELAKGSIAYQKLVVDNQKDFESALDGFEPNIILASHRLAYFDSRMALDILRARSIDVPVIILTPPSLEPIVETFGVDDYVVKNGMTRLPHAIKNALERYRLRHERHQIDRQREQVFHQTEANLKSIIDNTTTAYILLDNDLMIVSFNLAAARSVMQRTAKQLRVGESLVEYVSGERKKEIIERYASVLQGKRHTYEVSHQADSESLRWYEVNLFPVYDDAQVILGMVVALNDITMQKKEHERLKKREEVFQEMLLQKEAALKMAEVGLKEALARERRLRDEIEKIVSNDEAVAYRDLQALLLQVSAHASAHPSFKNIVEGMEAESIHKDQALKNMHLAEAAADGVHNQATIATDLATVMLIDDDDICNFVTRKTLEKAGVASRISAFQSAESALATLKVATADEFPDILFVDINMPMMDGWQFLSALEDLPSAVLEKCRIYMLSSTLDPRDIDRAEKSPIVKKLLGKPVSLATLYTLFKTH